MADRLLTTVDCAECLNAALGMEKAVGPWYIRDAIRRGELVAMYYKSGLFRRRAKFRISPADFELFLLKTTPELAPQVVAKVRELLGKAA